MRIHLKIKASKKIIPFNHQHLLTGVIHKWLGQNEQHGSVSLFSFSRIEKAKKATGGFQLGDYPYLFISAHDKEIINKLIKGVFKDRIMFCGLEVEDITIEEDPDLSNREYFNVGSPILIKRLTDKGTKHYKFNEPEADNFMKETLLTKMKLAGLEDDTLEISFDKDNIGASTKLVDYDGIKNRANWCSVIIKGKPETKLFAWNVGIGNSTGIGFGAIR